METPDAQPADRTPSAAPQWITVGIVFVGVSVSIFRGSDRQAARNEAELKAMAAELQAVRSELREANKRLAELQRDRGTGEMPP